ncbi:MAG: MBL fold metallo-hydrolase [Archaeoglobus sp.]|uniref:MBL fold metallo-hydrolase n=1 Tax=Archaeoglobus sp. TaxID=1872626 RepID=UPI001DA9D734|nr:MBL fold metallo-hydrolase [Archaeoglobus sp.]MBO8180733.1 MBL fold metallo-hydrolase [Archaeoglobus sp.]
MEVEIVKLKTPFTDLDHTYVYVVNSEIMVDGGFCNPQNAEKLEEFDVKRRIITHHHIDHVGLVFYSKKDVEIHKRELEFLEIYSKPEKFIEDYKRLFRIYGANENYADTLRVIMAMKLTKKARLLELIEDNQIIDTPGHTAGHISVLIDGCLFSGDFILSRTTPNVSFYPTYTSGVSDYLRSLEKCLKLDISEIFPAHEKRIKDPEKRITQLIEHYTSRALEVFDAVNSGYRTLEEIASEINWSIGNFRKFDDFNKFMALCETLAFLYYLREIGKVEEEKADGRVIFTVC